MTTTIATLATLSALCIRYALILAVIAGVVCLAYFILRHDADYLVIPLVMGVAVHIPGFSHCQRAVWRGLWWCP